MISAIQPISITAVYIPVIIICAAKRNKFKYYRTQTEMTENFDLVICAFLFFRCCKQIGFVRLLQIRWTCEISNKRNCIVFGQIYL